MILGVKNNNPANIRYSSLNKWKHQGKPNKGFCTFDSPVWGVRALLILIRKYRFSYGLDSVSRIISRFAPSSENDTVSYIKYVCNALGVSPDEELNLDFFFFAEFSQLYKLCHAICFIESNVDLSIAEFRHALSLVDSLTYDAYLRFQNS